LTETQACNTHACPIHCDVGEWSAWSECSASCGPGVQTRTRRITQQPANGGNSCPNTTETQACNKRICPPAYTHVGCFADKAWSGIPRPINYVGDGSLDGSIDSCAVFAKRLGNKVFAVQAGGQCMTDANAHFNYNKDGRSQNCYNGRGGDWANDVYTLDPNIQTPLFPNNDMIRSRRRDNFCVDISGGSKDNAAKAIMFDCHGGDNQRFTLDNQRRLIVKHSGKCLHASGTDNASHVVQMDCNDNNSQKWDADSAGRLRSRHAGKCLDVWENSDKNGAQLVIYDCHDGNNQKWFI
jgi:hypothetical protein